MSCITIGEDVYTPLSTIGCGGQGEIISALSSSSKTVAIKKFNISTPTGKLNYRTERKVLQRLMRKNPQNICPMLGYTSDDTFGYIAMECFSQDLFSMCIESTSSVPAIRIQQTFKSICVGVQSMHEADVAHLDIKPENILIGNNNSVALCDFACSEIFKRKPSRKKRSFFVPFISSRGTQEYSSLELLLGKKIDPFKADIFSLGVLLHVILTGHYPHVGEGEKRKLKIRRDLLTPDPYNLIFQMLHPKPRHRPNIYTVLEHPYLRPRSEIHKMRSSTRLMKKILVHSASMESMFRKVQVK